MHVALGKHKHHLLLVITPTTAKAELPEFEKFINSINSSSDEKKPPVSGRPSITFNILGFTAPTTLLRRSQFPLTR